MRYSRSILLSLLLCRLAWAIGPRCDQADQLLCAKGGNGVFDVATFGATGGDAVNDGTRIQAAADAADAAGGGIVQLNCATYLTDRAIRLGDNVTLAGKGRCSVIQRQDVIFNEPSFDASCAAVTDNNYREAIRNKKRNCGNLGITIRDLTVDGSAITTFPCTSCAATGTDPSVQIDLSAVSDTTIENVKLVSTPQDAIFLRGGGARTSVHHVVIDGHNLLWGNGSGINVEMHNPGNSPGTVSLEDIAVVSRGPLFCTNDLHLPCTVDGDCSGVGGTCGGGANAINGISVTQTDVGAVPPKAVISHARVETTDLHTGITLSACSGCTLTASRIAPFDSGTALAQRFLGIQIVGATSKTYSDVVVSNVTVQGSGLSGDKRGMLVDDASSGSTRVLVHGLVIDNKNLASGNDAVTIRGVTDGAFVNNTIQGITGGPALGIGSGSTTTSHLRVLGNTIDNITGSNNDCVRLINASQTRIEGNALKTCANGINFAGATNADTVIADNAYQGVTGASIAIGGGADATLFLDEPQVSFTAAGLPTANNGSRTYCSNCKNSAPCAATGSGFVAQRINGAWDCANYAVNAGTGAANLVAFWSSATALSADARFKYLAPNFGIASFTPLPSGFPASLLHIAHTANESYIADIYNATASGPQFIGRHARATGGSESTTQTPVVANDILFTLGGRGWGGDGTSGNGSFSSSSRAKVEGYATETYTAATGGARVDVTVTPNGSGTPAAQERLDQDGTKYLGTPLTAPGGGAFRTVSRSPDGNRNLYLDGNTPLVFDGATVTGTTNRTSVVVTDPTAARTLTIPDLDTTTVQAKSCSVTNQVLVDLSSSGVLSCHTIAAADLPGSFSGFANPTPLPAGVGFTVVNGSGTTAMFANAAPALAAVPAGMIRDMAHAQLGGM